MHSEEGQVIRRDRRSRKLAVVVAVQNVVVAACLMVTLFVYLEFQGRVSSPVVEDKVHIQVLAADASHSRTMQLEYVQSSYMMTLDKDRIQVICTGPYLAYLYVCFKNLSTVSSTAALQLVARGDDTPLSSFLLQTSHEACRGLHNITYLRAGQEVSVRLNITENSKIKNMTVGLSYLMGGPCDF